MESIQEQWMERALNLARRGWGTTHPNPMVGAVIVEGDAVLSEGFHRKAGEPHAESIALESLGRKPPPSCCLYVTLEPCSTRGRTPPCTTAILESGIRNVVVGTLDPNPDHAGRGIEILRDAGIRVTTGVLEAECRDLNLIFNHWISRKNSPFVAAKLALTLDGKIATRTGESKWVTGEAAREDVAVWRRYFPGIVAGAGTVLRDDPALTSRVPGWEVWCPKRFILDSQLRSFRENPGARVFSDHFREETTLVASRSCDPEVVQKAGEAGLEVWTVDNDENGRPSLDEFIKRCGRESIYGLWFEGGAAIISQLLRKKLGHALFAYIAPVVLGDEMALSGFNFQSPHAMDEALRLQDPRFRQLGEDYLVRGFIGLDASSLENRG